MHINGQSTTFPETEINTLEKQGSLFFKLKSISGDDALN